MKIEDAPLNTTLVFPVSKGTRIWARSDRLFTRHGHRVYLYGGVSRLGF